MTAIGDLVVNLNANRDKFSRELNRAREELRGFAAEAEKRLGKRGIGDILGSVAAVQVPTAAVVGAVAGLGAALVKSVNDFREAEKASRKLDAVLRATGNAAGLTGDEIRDYAGELQNLTSFDADDTTGAAAVLATFKNIKGDTFLGAIAAMQDMSAVMGTDLQGAAVQLGKALNDPVKGITALTRVGVSFTDQQKEQIKALQESGDLLGAQQIILAELQSEFGGAAQAMADPVVQAQNAIGDLSETIGGELAPYAKIAADELRGWVESVTSGVGSTGMLTGALGVLADELQIVIKGWAMMELQTTRVALAQAKGSEVISGALAAVVGETEGHLADMEALRQATLAHAEAMVNAQNTLDETPWSMKAEEMAQRYRDAAAAAAAGVTEFADSFDTLGAAADRNGDRVQDMLDAAARKLEQWGMTDEEKALSDLSALGASDEQLGAMAEMQRKLDELEQRKALEEAAGRTGAGSQALGSAGTAAPTQAGGGFGLAGVQENGSSGAWSTIMDNMQRKEGNAAKLAQQAQQQTAANTGQMAQLLDQLNQNLANNPMLQIPGG